MRTGPLGRNVYPIEVNVMGGSRSSIPYFSVNGSGPRSHRTHSSSTALAQRIRVSFVDAERDAAAASFRACAPARRAG